MKDNKLLNSLAAAAGYVGLLLASSGVVVLVFLILKVENERVVSICSAVFSVLTACLWLKNKNRDIKESLSLRRVPPKIVLMTVAVSVAVTLAVQCLQLAFPADMRRGFAGEVLTGNLALDAVCLILAAPVAEEIFFRALLIPALLGGMTQTAAIITASAVFAVLHDGIVWMIMAFFVSLFYSLVFVRTKSAIACIAAHMTGNLLAVAHHLLFV